MSSLIIGIIVLSGIEKARQPDEIVGYRAH
jgi:hypothetical protein